MGLSITCRVWHLVGKVTGLGEVVNHIDVSGDIGRPRPTSGTEVAVMGSEAVSQVVRSVGSCLPQVRLRRMNRQLAEIVAHSALPERPSGHTSPEASQDLTELPFGTTSDRMTAPQE